MVSTTSALQNRNTPTTDYIEDGYDSQTIDAIELPRTQVPHAAAEEGNDSYSATKLVLGQGIDENQNIPSSTPPLDGGLEAWLATLGGFCCFFVSFGWVNCVGLFQAYYEKNQLKEYSSSTIAWIPSVQVFLMFFGGLITGSLTDKYGPRYVLLAGTFLQVFGLMMASLATEYYQVLLAQGICSAMGSSAIMYSALGPVMSWWRKKTALANGIVASGSSLGGVIFPIMISKLLPRIGFAWSMRSAAFLILVIANVTVKSRLPPNPKPVQATDVLVPFKELTFTLCALGTFCFFIGLFPPLTYIVAYSEHVGMPTELSVYMLCVLNAASLFGRILPGALADIFGRFNALILMSFLSAVTVLAIWIPARSNAATIVFAAVFGFTSGAFISLTPAIIAAITTDMTKIGVRVGAVFTLCSFAGLVGSPIAGRLLAVWNGKFTGLQIFAGFMEVVGMLLFIAARWRHAGVKVKA